jgi:hypothetical protein
MAVFERRDTARKVSFRARASTHNKDQPGYPTVDVELRKGHEEPTYAVDDTEQPPRLYERNSWDPERGIYPLPHTSPQGQQGRMFAHVPPKIDWAISDPAMRVAVPTVMALALHEGQKTGKVQADSDLSKYSAPLVRRAVSAGVVDPPKENPNVKVTNDIGQYEVPNNYSWESQHGWETYKPVASEDLTQARDTVRSVLRGRKEKTPSPRLNGAQFRAPRPEQGTLF